MLKKMNKRYKKTLRYFSKFGLKYFSNYLEPLKKETEKTNLNMVFEMYVGRMFFYSVFFSIFNFIIMTFILLYTGLGLISFVGGFIFAFTGFWILIFAFHSYPFHIITSKRKSIDDNMPFAINHMSAIASSGVAPYVMFKLIGKIKEYGEFGNETERITENIELFGMDILNSIKQVSKTSPSEKLSKFLNGIISTIESGGDLKSYLDKQSENALIDYKLKREKYLSSLSTYADFYTAILIAAPLFFVSVLSVMSMIGGEIMGMGIPEAMNLGVYFIIPLFNILFLAFVHYTQPGI